MREGKTSRKGVEAGARVDPQVFSGRLVAGLGEGDGGREGGQEGWGRRRGVGFVRQHVGVSTFFLSVTVTFFFSFYPP